MRIALLWFLVFGQEDARHWAQQLESDSPAAREEAVERLRKIGPGVIPELQRVAASGNAEAAAQARNLLRYFDFDRRLSPGLKKAFPDLAMRLASGGSAACREVLLSLSDAKAFSDLRREALEPLAEPAFGGLAPGETLPLLKVLNERDVDVGIGLLRSCLLHPDRDIRWEASWVLKWDASASREVLSWLEAPETRLAALEILDRRRRADLVDWNRFLADPDPKVRELVLDHCAWTATKDRLLSLCDAASTDPHPMVRRKMTDILLQRVTGEGLLLLLHMIEDEDCWVAANAMAGLGRLQVTDAVPVLLRKVQGKDRFLRDEAVKALAQMGPSPEVEATLGGLLGGRSAEVSAKTLVRLGSTQAGPWILKALKANPRDRAALSAAAALRFRDAVPLLLEGVEAGAGECAPALGRIGDRKVIPELIRMLKGPAEQAGAAARALVHLHATDARDALGAALKEARAETRRAILIALFDLGDLEAGRRIEEDDAESLYLAALAGKPEAVPTLLNRVEEEHPHALLFLTFLKAREAVPAVMRHAQELPYPHWSLAGRITAEDLPAIESALLQEDHEWACLTLAFDNDKASLGILEVHFRSCPCREGFLALAARQSGVLREKLKPPYLDYELRAIGQLEDPAYGSAILDRLYEKPRDYDSHESVRVLAKLRCREAIPRLEKLLESDSIEAVREAAAALARLESRTSIPALKSLLPHRSGVLRGIAANALCRLGSTDGVPEFLAAASRDPASSLFALNAIRNPAAWRRAMDARFAGAIYDLPRVQLREVVRSAGLTLEEPRHWPWHLTSEGVLTFLGHPGKGAPAGEVLEEIISKSRLESMIVGGSWVEDALILEGDTVRVLPRPEGLRFWRDWWEKEKLRQE